MPDDEDADSSCFRHKQAGWPVERNCFEFHSVGTPFSRTTGLHADFQTKQEFKFVSTIQVRAKPVSNVPYRIPQQPRQTNHHHSKQRKTRQKISTLRSPKIDAGLAAGFANRQESDEASLIPSKSPQKNSTATGNLTKSLRGRLVTPACLPDPATSMTQPG